VLGLYSLNYSQGRIGYSGPVVDTSVKPSLTGASVNDAWSRVNDSFTPLPGQAEKIAPSNSITDSVTRDLIDLYLQAREKDGGVISASTTEALASSVVKYGKGYINVNRYTNTDILLDPLDTVEAQKNYVNALAMIIHTDFQGLPSSAKTTTPPELAAFEETLRTNNLKNLSNIEPYRSAYAKATKDLLAVRVPSSYASVHLDMLNSFATSEESLSRMMQFATDPLGALYGMRAYVEEYARAKHDITLLVDTVKQTSLVFTQDEPAYGLLAYLTKPR